MIAKIVQGRGFRGVVNYVLDKDNAQLLYAEGVRTKRQGFYYPKFRYPKQNESEDSKTGRPHLTGFLRTG